MNARNHWFLMCSDLRWARFHLWRREWRLAHSRNCEAAGHFRRFVALIFKGGR